MREEELAIHGGPKVKTDAFGTGKRFGTEEAKELLDEGISLAPLPFPIPEPDELN